MSSKLKINKEVFINEVVIPFYSGLNQNKSTYLIYDNDGTIITGSQSFAAVHGYSKIEQIKGKTVPQIYKFGDHCPNFCDDVGNIRLEVIEKKVAVDYLCVAEFSCGITAYTVQQSPIFDSEGKVIATIVVLGDLPYHQSNQNGQILSKRQAEIVFLLSIGASQKEIASIFNVTRGTVAKTIENISVRLDLIGSSERNIIEKAREIGYGILPVDVIKPGVIRISKLYANHQILALFQNNINDRQIEKRLYTDNMIAS